MRLFNHGKKYVHTPQDQVELDKLLKGAMFYALFPLAYSLLMGEDNLRSC